MRSRVGATLLTPGGCHADLRGLGEDVLDDVEDLIDGERLDCVSGVQPRLLPRIAQRGDLWGVGLRVEGRG